MSLGQYDPAIAQGYKLAPSELSGNNIMAVNTNGTTPVSVFGAAGLGTNATVVGVYLTALDTTAGNVTLENPQGTVVATIAKGTTAGAMVGAATLANTAFTAASNLIVRSSSAGNATVYVAYNVVSL